MINFYSENVQKEFPLTPACERAAQRAKAKGFDVEMNGFWWSIAIVSDFLALEVDDDFHNGEWVGCSATEYVYENGVWVERPTMQYATLAEFQGDLEGWLS